MTIVIEAVERLFEEKEIKDPNLLLYVGCIGLGINIVGLFVFGHAHSHNVPSLPVDEDSSDASSLSESEVNTTPSVRTDEAPEADALEEKKLSQARENTMLVLEKTDPEKFTSSKKKIVVAQKNKKKTPKCHILCNSFYMYFFLLINFPNNSIFDLENSPRLIIRLLIVSTGKKRNKD